MQSSVRKARPDANFDMKRYIIVVVLIELVLIGPSFVFCRWWLVFDISWCCLLPVLVLVDIMSNLDFPCHKVYITGWFSTRPLWSSWALAEAAASSSQSSLAVA